MSLPAWCPPWLAALLLCLGTVGVAAGLGWLGGRGLTEDPEP